MGLFFELRIHRSVMPGDLIFHEGDTLPLYRIGQDGCGSFLGGKGLLYPFRQGVHVVPVNFHNLHPEGLEFIR